MTRVFLLTLFGIGLFAQGVDWQDWERAVAKAEATGKIIMIEAVRNHCHYCEAMQRTVFEDDAMAAKIDRRFIPVRVNISEEAMPLGLKVSMTPSFYFIAADQKLIKTIPGSWNREDFSTILEEVKP